MEKKTTFIQLVEDNERLIYKVASFYTDNGDDRDDLVQEIIYNLWRSFQSFKNNSSLTTWMYRVAMNVSILYLKKNKRRIATVPINEEVSNVEDTPVDNFEENLLKLQKHIQQLNLLEKGIVMLYLESRSHEEIAEITGLSKTNVGTKLSRIKEKLKQQVSKNN
ncbi:MAG TPA: sigma-70 family RNA polymerase sigma factor [Chryseosolibacter sp.]|nr:sigma-70 family RNA polymerase sigma factor [Chryseosolibacter sp.]